MPQDKKSQKQIEKETENKEEKKVEETVKKEEEEKESKKKGSGFYDEEMNKKPKGKPDYGSSNEGFFGGEMEKFNFEENENDDFFENIENIAAERPKFFENTERGTEEKSKQRGGHYEGAKREKESFNFQETEDVERFFGNVEKAERENEERKRQGNYYTIY